jgi:two-component system OmpR family response regulator
MTTIDSAPGESTQPRRVLLVDDSVDAAEAMSMLLETLGHEIRVMHDGPSAPGSTIIWSNPSLLLQ